MRGEGPRERGRRALPVPRFAPSPQLPRTEDGLKGAVALGMQRLGPNGDRDATDADAPGMRSRRGRGSFQAHKGHAKSRRAQ